MHVLVVWNNVNSLGNIDEASCDHLLFIFSGTFSIAAHFSDTLCP